MKRPSNLAVQARKKFLVLASLIFIPSCILFLAKSVRPPLNEGLSFSKRIYDRSGNLLRLTLSQDQKFRVWSSLEEVSPLYVQALLLLEDQYFYQHLGVNPISIAKAFLNTYVKQTRRVGGSTLTMQVARIKFGIYSKSIFGKLEQILRSIQLELLYSKKEILEAYLNLAPFGGNIEGIWAASQVYLHKDPKDLTWVECLSLVVIPQNPNERSLKFAKDTTKIDLPKSKLSDKWIRKFPEYQKRKVDLHVPFRTFGVAQLPFGAPHLTDTLLSSNLFSDVIQSTVHLDLQTLVETQVKAYVQSKKEWGIRNAAAFLVDHQSGDVLAYVGSSDYRNPDIEGEVNGILAKRSPGSTLKPFIYALGLDQGILHPRTILKDAPSSFGSYDPENFDREFSGPISVHDALIESRNIPAVAVASQLKSPSLYDFLIQVGITRLKSEKYYGLALPLGGAELTLEELVRLYSSLAEQGVYRKLRYDLKKSIDTGQRLLTRESAFIIMQILKDNPRPHQNFNSRWTRDDFPVYWKTGTSHGFRDAWSIGVVGSYVLGVWVGNFNGEGNPAFIGREVAGPLLFQIIDALRNSSSNFKSLQLDIPTQVKQVPVCAISGMMPGPHCKKKVNTWFIPGKSPIKVCDIHREVLVDSRNGKRLCPNETAGKLTRSEIYEIWPSDLLKLFKKAGIPRKTPPAYDKRCVLLSSAGNGSAPLIQSPKSEVVYSLRLGSETPIQIPLVAAADGGVKELYWFVNGEYVGKVNQAQTLFWKARPGKFLIRVVDNEGRSDSRDLQVKMVQ